MVRGVQAVRREVPRACFGLITLCKGLQIRADILRSRLRPLLRWTLGFLGRPQALHQALALVPLEFHVGPLGPY